MKKDIIIFGSSSLGQSVDFYLTRDSCYNVVAYTISKEHQAKHNLYTLNNKPVIAFEEIELKFPPNNYGMFVAIGYVNMNRLRKEIMNAAKEKGYSFISYMCSSASNWGDVDMGENVFIFDNNNIQPSVKIGNGVILGRGNSIGHDTIIEDYCFLANHAVLCGNCTIGESTFIGSNATIADGVKVASKTLVGAHSFIKKNTNPEDVYIVPQTPKILKKSSSFFNW